MRPGKTGYIFLLALFLFLLFIPAGAAGPYHFMQAADGTSIRYGHWPVEDRRGVVVLLTGRTESMEKYSETIVEFQKRGFSVWSLDWRGQGLSGRKLEDREKGHVSHFDQFLGDLDQLFDEIILAREEIGNEFGPRSQGIPIYLAAHSMGGHLALRYVARRSELFRGAILAAPMVDIEYAPIPAFVVRGLSAVTNMLGFSDSYTLGGTGFDYEAPFDGNDVTHDPDRWGRNRQDVRKNPDLAVGSPTFGWLNAAIESIDVLDQDGYAEAINLPTLIFTADEDQVVSSTAAQNFCHRMTNCEHRPITGAYHELYQETDAVREQVWSQIDRFTAETR